MKKNVTYKNFRNWFPVLLFAIVGACGGTLALLISILEINSDASTIILPLPTDGFILLSLSIILLYITYEYLPRLEQLMTTDNKDDIEARLTTLTKALSDAGQIINSIEQEISSRQELVSKLETQKALAERAITLNKEQVEAVTALLNQEISKQSKADAKREFLKDLSFFIAGVIVTIALGQLG